MRVDGSDSETLAFDNMDDRPLRGTTGWTQAEVVLNVRSEADQVLYGVLLAGSGTVRVAGIELEPVGDAVPVTRRSTVPGCHPAPTR